LLGGDRHRTRGEFVESPGGTIIGATVSALLHEEVG
jgi:hypothetical protein